MTTDITPFAFFPVRVSRVQDLTPGFRRVTFVDESLAHFADPGWDQRIKLLFAKPGADPRKLLGSTDWFTDWRELPDEARPPIRTYTTRYVRQHACEIDVDLVVHPTPEGVQPGPASEWLETAQPGDELVILGPNARYDGEPGGVDFVPPARTERFLLVGDETAAPAIAVMLEQLPDDAQGVAVIEVEHEADAEYFPAHPGFSVRVVAREGRPHGDALVPAVKEATAELAPEGEPQTVTEINIDTDLLWEVPRTAKGGAALEHTTLYAWLAGESQSVKTLRRHLVGERGIDKRTVAFMGYWRLGKAEN
ncbi:siderophore-interacting protein [Gulosibacter faecalis]|uniref:Siderophore-interacting protein n=1 Tax=Gulosibacter faecalis TaxID=272240 RepID=A0ABW5UWY2_9MICO|nr:siderophore-interacting protein [Gulosibacter faecalis]